MPSVRSVTLFASCVALFAAVPVVNANGSLHASRQAVMTPGTATKSLHKRNTKRSLPAILDVHEDNANLPLSTRGGGDDNEDAMAGLLQRLKIGGYFALWYALNVIYNILNKKVLNVLPAPLTVGGMQFGVGALYAGALWLTKIRASPKITPEGRKLCNNIGIYHAAGQLLSMISLGAGPVSFTHIVKALEPFFSAAVSALVFGKWMKPQVYASLIPVVGGVGYACLKERSFSWLAFWTAMGSNLAFALRAVVSKSAMVGNIGENITSTNLFGIVTWYAFFLSIPIALIGEGTSFLDLWSKATTATTTGEGAEAAVVEASDPLELARAVIISGLFHYLNNEVMYLALGNVHPVTLAVGNTMKRVFIMVASIIVFRNPVSVQAGIGSAVGISGVLLYSLTKQHYEKLEAEEAEAEKKS
mmetsp:Transcript_4980/g.6862  ORF Transcript_4980/g.6862 Transcript_4980/m.6862 type:complete len:417 (-) Transcript_4980:208-1458(-)|eukprot:CAMPEP_0185740742 /NCGR_PEP_ID=MMETSP1171-20130828/38522_1 /TAXON_ID=374046 /ORGANISM="Helicotheca tamensis, Strain CCMP826" /LENGTH=416 /DNA_ID=CAMNT_0028412659 /DNA_START=125 /DNA_END=1375 /DNA_ORIENTATION=+